jgi:4-methyl-5(b-hydroxyethyl)-thiazole monophosphate biosynthesis
MADVSIEDAAKEEWDLVALPGGMPGKYSLKLISIWTREYIELTRVLSGAGATHLRDSAALISILEKQKKDGKPYAAICAAPAVVLASHGLIEEGATCYPAPHFLEKLTNPTDDNVAVTGQLTTSKGPGTALEFALELGEQLFGKEVRDKIEKEMLF